MPPEVWEHRALDDRKASSPAVLTALFEVLVCGSRPSYGALGRDPCRFMAGRIRQALVQNHHDVRPQGELDVDGRFGREQM